jgi:hypothetical protein
MGQTSWDVAASAKVIELVDQGHALHELRGKGDSSTMELPPPMT